jgi:hypothetical protein
MLTSALYVIMLLQCNKHRCQVHHALWTFTALPNGSTKLQMESRADPKGGVPAKLMNWLQKTFPAHTMNTFVSHARSAQPEKRLASW